MELSAPLFREHDLPVKTRLGRRCLDSRLPLKMHNDRPMVKVEAISKAGDGSLNMNAVSKNRRDSDIVNTGRFLPRAHSRDDGIAKRVQIAGDDKLLFHKQFMQVGCRDIEAMAVCWRTNTNWTKAGIGIKEKKGLISPRETANGRSQIGPPFRCY